MMLLFFLSILMGLPWVDTTINNTSGFNNITRGLAREYGAVWKPQISCHTCYMRNSFSCPKSILCPYDDRRCVTIAFRVNIRLLYVYKDCIRDCTFMYREHVPPELPRVLKDVKNFYFTLCCSSAGCNDGGPSNTERDLLDETSIEEEVVTRAVNLGLVNLLLCLTLILSSSILT